MLNPTVDFSGRPFHFIGVGGIGMSAIAHILLKQGYSVSGSDINSNANTDRLKKLGAKIYQGHSATNLDITAQPQIVCSTAINQQNPEYQTAIEADLPVLHRSDILAALMHEFKSIAVAGTHGKTTTSSLVAYLLLKAGVDPTIVVGGEVSDWQGNARLGAGHYLVAEADESDGSLTKFDAHIGIITNIELDHPDHYTSLDQVIETFQAFVKRCQTVIACIDCPTTQQQINADLTYSIEPASGADYIATDIQYGAAATEANIIEQGTLLGRLRLSIIGEHNLANALAAIAVARNIGIDWETIATSIGGFEGARRRFEYKGSQSGVVFVDDYAHHPSEIRATLASAKLKSQGRVVAIFQPHRYSRILSFLTEFSAAFADADLVVVTDIYAAGEKNHGNIDGAKVTAAIASMHPNVHYQGSLQSVQNFLVTKLRANDLAIFLGAGNLNQIIAPTIQSMADCCSKPTALSK
ncbi:UDP-N-acetylmuramate--L-alanine ligase [Thalassoporum mexicanum PCC 7367]|uniref:UDP-N-acetylmuramate--L-alanine ligase n=1 Tax=Thalassoporum mexicanum TaxID=3457544 RepID=UPI00029FA081|nr:UDP-N-acetylmuramate--L-alanine ligase [Pseudanabaena sp. PCC 7367]AFY69613.1 UDP-N-acetylmuramate--L-alanine ligase [Pseudanabaena sp. PCC 7367]